MYKQGQAGITKATVSIVFDNTEKERGPVRLLGCLGAVGKVGLAV